MACLDPIGLVQPISSTTNIGFLPISILLAQAYERYEEYGSYGHGGYECSYVLYERYGGQRHKSERSGAA